jgi:2-polyprenyl-3-methyl-5-hydroxy-6-metoxy-1,4-benzoquinol methylase
MRPIFERTLSLLEFSVPQPRTLEYGCGTGPGAYFLATRGFQVDGIDISPIAIGMAKEFAAQRGLTINYGSPGIAVELPICSGGSLGPQSPLPHWEAK